MEINERKQKIMQIKSNPMDRLEKNGKIQYFFAKVIDFRLIFNDFHFCFALQFSLIAFLRISIELSLVCH